MVVAMLFIASVTSSGCALRRSATFLPASEVRRIRVSQSVNGRQVSDARLLDDPEQIAQLYAFLDEHEEGWEPLWDTPWAGDYSIHLETDDSWQSIFVVDNTMQTNSGGVPIKRKLSPESHQRLIALLGLEPGRSSQNRTEATLASHSGSD